MFNLEIKVKVNKEIITRYTNYKKPVLALVNGKYVDAYNKEGEQLFNTYTRTKSYELDGKNYTRDQLTKLFDEKIDIFLGGRRRQTREGAHFYFDICMYNLNLEEIGIILENLQEDFFLILYIVINAR